MNGKLAYDLPTRIFHWLFAILFTVSFFIANVIDDDSALYAYHMLSGILMSVLVVLRILWGFIGTRYSRFSTFMLSLKSLLDYSSALVFGKTKKYMNHNPASSYAAIIMFCFTLALLVTGLLMSNHIYKDFFEEVHELVANGFLIIVLLHIAGVLFHHLRHRDGILWTMISGRKKGLEGQEEIKSQSLYVAILFLAIIIFSASKILLSYNSTTQKFRCFSVEFQLGEAGNHHEGNGKHRYDGDEDDDEGL